MEWDNVALPFLVSLTAGLLVNVPDLIGLAVDEVRAWRLERRWRREREALENRCGGPRRPHGPLGLRYLLDDEDLGIGRLYGRRCGTCGEWVKWKE